MHVHEKAWGNACRALGQLESFLGPQPHNDDVLRAAIIQAFEVTFEAVWKLLQDRNLTVHTYNAAVAERIALAVRQRYAPALRTLLDALAPEPSK